VVGSRIGRRSLLCGLLLAAAGTKAASADAAGVPVVDRVLVIKSERRLFLLWRGEVVRVYPVRLGANPVGPKIFALDGRTPEGVYVIDSRKSDSQYFRSLHISYPSTDDRARAAKYGISAGGNIRIHGTPRESGRFLGDWTDGCIAVSNAAMREIWDAVSIGTPIEIRP
jgi:murein L,D-transpeptidase YafK